MAPEKIQPSRRQIRNVTPKTGMLSPDQKCWPVLKKREKILRLFFFSINDYFNCAASDLYRQVTECSIDDVSPFNFL